MIEHIVSSPGGVCDGSPSQNQIWRIINLQVGENQFAFLIREVVYGIIDGEPCHLKMWSIVAVVLETVLCACMYLSDRQRLPFAANNQPKSNQWFHRDVDAMCNLLNTAPVFIDADKSNPLIASIFCCHFHCFSGQPCAMSG